MDGARRDKTDPLVIVFNEIKRCQHPHSTPFFRKAKKNPRGELRLDCGKLSKIENCNTVKKIPSFQNCKDLYPMHRNTQIIIGGAKIAFEKMEWSADVDNVLSR